MDSFDLLRKEALQNRGIFNSNSIKWAYGLPSIPQLISEIHWQTIPLQINERGTLMVSNDKMIINNLHECGVTLVRDQLIIKLSINNQKVILLKLIDEKEYLKLLSALLVWISLKPPGVFNKWTSTNATLIENSNLNSNPNDVIKSKFKIFGPNASTSSVSPIYPKPELSEGWLDVSGQLKSNGTIHLFDNDDKFLFSIDISNLFNSEIKIIDKSIFKSSNCLFIGILEDFRNFHNEMDILICPEFKFTNRFILEFKSNKDLQDWFIAIQSMSKFEFIGDSFELNSLRLSNSTSLEILQAELIPSNKILDGSELFAELEIWGAPWFRTASVKPDTVNQCFWKEVTTINLSYFKKSFNINIKSILNGKTIGVCSITPDLFIEDQILKRVPILNLQGKNIGELLINLTSIETHILPYKSYKYFEQLFLNSKINGIISLLEKKVNTSNLKDWSLMLLNIYQSLQLEETFLNALLLHELKPIRVKNKSFNTLFRGNSILSISFEEYSKRVGQHYINELLGEIIHDIENSNLDCDPKSSTGYEALLIYCERIWERIFKTTNDLPTELKSQWRNLRRNVELSINPNDSETPLNALCAFVFLRFLCPPILNPKMFNLSNTHLTGNSSKTLTLIAKVLMTFGNRSKFQEMKDPNLVQLNNDFIDKHKDEMLIYFDKVTMRKIDFNERKLNIEDDENKRNDTNQLANLPSQEILNELPIRPYLIDKNLNFSKLVEIIHENKIEDRKLVRRKSYQLDDLIVFDNDEFMNSAIDFDDDEFNQLLVIDETSIGELINQSNFLMSKLKDLEIELFQAETPDNFSKILSFEDHIKAKFSLISLNDDYQLFVGETNRKPTDLKFANELKAIIYKSKNPVIQNGHKLPKSSSSMSIRKSISKRKLSLKPHGQEENLNRTSTENKRKSSIFGKLFSSKN